MRLRTWFFLLLCTSLAFGGGILLDRTGWLPGPANRPPADLGHDFDTFWETWHLVEHYYVDRNAVQRPKMTRGAIQGMLSSLGDEGHTVYLSPTERKHMRAEMQGQVEDIGASVAIRDHRPVVIRSVPGSPAAEVGLRPGDVIAAVDGKMVTGLSLAEVEKLIRGPAGSQVRLRVFRKGANEPLEFCVGRARVAFPDVTWHIVPGTRNHPIVHLGLHRFGTDVDDQLRAALEAARKHGAQAIVLDLRGDLGGLKEQAIRVASEFLKDGVVLQELDYHGKRSSIAVRDGGIATEMPMCVLIDGRTASSAEIVAGALQDHGRAVLVGTRTFGAGTILQPFELSDGSAILLAVAEWFTPNGRTIWHKGIAPDIEVPLPDGAVMVLPEMERFLSADELAGCGDRQFLRALALLKGRLEKASQNR
jgi:carboxyl-terminal processing protease